MGVVLKPGGSRDDGPRRPTFDYTYSTSTSIAHSPVVQATIGTTTLGAAISLLIAVIWAGPLTIATAVVSAIGAGVEAVMAFPAATLLGWTAAQGAAIGLVYGFARLLTSGRRRASVRIVEFLVSLPSAAIASTLLAFVGLFGLPGLFVGEAIPGNGGTAAALASLKFLPGAGGPPPAVAAEDYAALILFIVVLMVVAIIVGLVSGKITGAMIGKILVGAVQDSLKEATTEAAKAYAMPENEGSRVSGAACAARAGAASGALSGAISTAIGLHLAIAYAPPGSENWITLLIVDIVAGVLALFVVAVCKMLLANESG